MRQHATFTAHLTASATRKLRANPSTRARTVIKVAGGQLVSASAALPPARPTALMAA